MLESSDNAKFAKEFIKTAYPSTESLPPEWAQVLNVVGEAGEFAEAYRRYVGHARRVGNFEEVSQELADIVISAYVTAERLGINLDAEIKVKQEAIMVRGFKDIQE